MHNWNPRYTSCPAGTRWYVCSNNKFSGCCPIDPCDQEACPTNALTTTLQISSHSDILSSTTTSSSHRVSPTATSDPERSISPDPGKTTGLPVLTAVGLALGALVIGKILGILMWILIRKYLWVRWVQKPDLTPGGAHTRVQVEPGTSIPELEALPYSQPPQSTACEMPNESPASPPQLLSPDSRTEACITDWTKL